MFPVISSYFTELFRLSTGCFWEEVTVGSVDSQAVNCHCKDAYETHIDRLHVFS